jgi:Cu+-exporting ATPase
MTELGIETSALQDSWDRLEYLGKTVVWMAVDGEAEAILGIADAVKPSSAGAIRALQRMGLEVVMLTGDNRRTAEVIAREVGIQRVLAEVRPDQKASVIAALQQGDEERGAVCKIQNSKFKIPQEQFKIQNPKSKIIAMVGDGITEPKKAQARV